MKTQSRCYCACLYFMANTSDKNSIRSQSFPIRLKRNRSCIRVLARNRPSSSCWGHTSALSSLFGQEVAPFPHLLLFYLFPSVYPKGVFISRFHIIQISHGKDHGGSKCLAAAHVPSTYSSKHSFRP